MRKVVSTFMVAMALVALINPLGATCDPNGHPATHDPGTCVSLIIDPEEPPIEYCDINLGPGSAERLCWKELFPY